VQIPEVEISERALLSSAKTALIIVDMQNDFVHEDGALSVPAAAATVAPIAGLLERARSAGAKVIFTQDWHSPDDPEFSIWPRHAVAESWGAEIVEELAPLAGETLIRKLRYDAFYGTPLAHLLHTWGIENTVIVGTVANICVLHTAGSAALRWYRVILPRDGVSALSDFDMHAALRQVSFLYQGMITTTEGVVFS